MVALYEFGHELTAGRRKGQGFSFEARYAMIAAVKGGADRKVVAKAFACSPGTVAGQVRRWDAEQETIRARERRGRNRIILLPANARLHYRVRRTPRMTFRERRDALRNLVSSGKAV
ncbi:hypothetical protein GGR53DRAFT_54756 [Hypoxylon sp. FL1150]|nr:hypothetical protein GGR53DRAFT_54756 [Hypoxylon sp. FL1150]